MFNFVVRIFAQVDKMIKYSFLNSQTYSARNLSRRT